MAKSSSGSKLTNSFALRALQAVKHIIMPTPISPTALKEYIILEKEMPKQ